MATDKLTRRITINQLHKKNQLGHKTKWLTEVKKLVFLLQGANREAFIKSFDLYDQGRKRFASRSIAAGFIIPDYSIVTNYEKPTQLLLAIYRIAQGEMLSDIAFEMNVEIQSLAELVEIITNEKLREAMKSDDTDKG